MAPHTRFLAAPTGPCEGELVISDACEGIKAAVTKLMNATWQRCRVHTMHNALAHVGKSNRRVVSAFIATAFAQEVNDWGNGTPDFHGKGTAC